MKWIKLFEEFNDSDMIITAFFEELNLEGEYKHAEMDGFKFYMTQILKETNNQQLLDTIRVLEQRLGDNNMSVCADYRMDRKLTLVIYDKRTLTQTIEKWIQEAYSRILGSVEDQVILPEEEDYNKELLNEIELVNSVKIDSVRGSTPTEKLLNTQLIRPPFHISLNIEYEKGPDGIRYNNLEYFINELRWSLVDMLKTELDFPENSLRLFKLEKINI